ncbi:MAG TPA: hypothetical protein VFQ35_14080, partial [Polyangiaceae bacterium]|nr:hypothetical protein [Polyangiaceae bacterium]
MISWSRLALLVLLLFAWPACSGDDTPGPGGAGGLAAGGQSGNGSGGTGAAATGGTGNASGGDAEEGGSSSSSGGAHLNAPPAWRCIEAAYGDGRCDCGCGAPDIDCAEQNLAQCEVCNNSGSCSAGACPGRIDVSDVSHCLAVPNAWRCERQRFGDGVCDCGCQTRDVDCPDANASSCESCSLTGSCARAECPATILENDNAHCAVPARWSCAPETYGD